MILHCLLVSISWSVEIAGQQYSCHWRHHFQSEVGLSVALFHPNGYGNYVIQFKKQYPGVLFKRSVGRGGSVADPLLMELIRLFGILSTLKLAFTFFFSLYADLGTYTPPLVV